MGILRNVLGEVIKPVLVDVSNRFWSRSPITLKVEYDGVTQFNFKFKAPSTSTLNIYDGDGTMTPVAGQDDVLVTHTTIYATVGTYYFYVEGDYVDLTSIDIEDMSMVSGSMSGYGVLINLVSFIPTNTGIYGDIGVLSNCPNLVTVKGLRCNVTGDVSDLRYLENLLFFNIVSSSTLLFSSSEAWASSGFFGLRIQGNVSSSGVDNMIKAFKGLSGKKVAIAGNNPRTSDSFADIITMLGNGNSLAVTEDEITPIDAELHTDANAASDPNDNEADATTGWSQTGLDVGANEFVSQQLITAKGDNAFKTDVNDTPTSAAGISKVFTVVAGDIMRSSFDWRHLGEGLGWGVSVDGNVMNSAIDYFEDEFFNITCYSTSKTTSYTILIKEYNALNTGGIYMDNFSFGKLTLS